MSTRRWLVKTDPRLFSFDDLTSSSRTIWDGTRHPLAVRHLRSMRRGDDVLVYHSGSERAVVGLATVVRGPRADASGGWSVTLAARGRLERPVPRRALAGEPGLGAWELVRLPRLTILPVPAGAWQRVRSKARRPRG